MVKVEQSTGTFAGVVVVYYESIKGELQRRRIYECRYDERVKTKLRDLHDLYTLGY
jgi:hypothetical protein